MNLTPTGFGIIVAILLVVAVIVVAAENIRVRHENAAQDAAQDEDDNMFARNFCAANGCNYKDDHGVWVCRNCGDVVRPPLSCAGFHRYVKRGQSLECTVCGHRTVLPFDQESGLA